MPTVAIVTAETIAVRTRPAPGWPEGRTDSDWELRGQELVSGWKMSADSFGGTTRLAQDTIRLTSEQAQQIAEVQAASRPAVWGEPFAMTSDRRPQQPGEVWEYLGGGGIDDQERVTLPHYRIQQAPATPPIEIDLDGASLPHWLDHERGHTR